tara:strand:+ start:454 stop:1209 length:756 start_codon:yes stop_codon:yes gene_type:complete
MINYKEKSLVILPHLDDEFALVPILKKFSKYSEINKIKFLFCCERRKENNEKLFKRRIENINSLKFFNIKRKQIIYLNDFYFSNDLEISKNFKEIIKIINRLYEYSKFSQILTLAFEGGHPDHDALALIVKKFVNNKNIKIYFFPAYNYQSNFIIPFTILKPLKSQKHLFKFLKISKFCWIRSLKIAIIYKSEYKAFLKLIPFLIYNTIFVDGIYFANRIEINSVDWEKSLSKRRYKKTKEEITKVLDYKF